MSNTNEIIITEKQNIVAIADAVRSKTNTTSSLTLGGIVNGINGIQTGVNLPKLTNPATESEVFLGKEYIDENGEMKTGTFAMEDTPSAGDNTLLISLLQGEYRRDKPFVCDVPLEKLGKNFGDFISNVELMDINTARLEDGSLPIALQTLILRYNGVTTLDNAATLSNTCMSDIDGDQNYGGYIYVPQKYLAQYQSGTNWSAADNGSFNWRQIEGSEYE